MDEHTAAGNESRHPRRFGKWAIAIAMLAPIGAFYLLREHWSHSLGLLPYLLLLACPLMHLFGHRHRRQGGRQHRS